MQLGMNNRVWDYAGDNYVHRLLQNKTDGKPVEVECNPNAHVNDEKIDAVQLEYTYLLTNQLENQRHYFEETISRIEKDAQAQIEEILDKSKIVVEERDQLSVKWNTLVKEKQAQDKKINQVNTKLSKALSELQEEREMNKSMRENQSLWQKKLQDSETRMSTLIQAKDKEVQELKEQVRDLMFFLEAQEKLKDVSDATREEIEEGQVVVPASASASGTSPSVRTKTKGKRR
jgi:BRCA1-associated protein